MDNKGGFHIVGKDGLGSPSPDDDPVLGATGFYYITPADAWDDPSFFGRHRFTRLFTLPGYIWHELLKGVLMAAAVFSAVLMAVFAGQVMRDGIGPYTLFRIIPNFLPLICPFVLPLAIVTGIIVCYSRLAKDNEILAAYAGGVNPFWLMLPAILTSIIAIFITLTLNEVALMPAIRGIERLVLDDQANILRRMITRPGNITVNTGNEYVAMSKIEPSRDPQLRSSLDITRFSEPEKNATKTEWDPRYPFPAKRIVARDHEIEDFSETGSSDMVLKMLVSKPVFQDLHTTDINRTFIADGESGEERMVLKGRPHATIHSNRSSFWPILMLSETRREAEERIRELESSGQRLQDMPEAQRAASQDMSARLQRVVLNRTSEINMRLALCFSCLAFAILGIPLGMRTRGTLVTSFVIGMITAGVYFLILKSAESQVGKGLLPYWAIWIPDVLVVLLGAVLWILGSRRI